MNYKSFEGDVVPSDRVKKAVEFLLQDWLENDECACTTQLYQLAEKQVLMAGCIKTPDFDLDELGWWQVEQILDILYPEG